eukprot:353323-Chlamydomonas_euryale.AAC.5
MRTLSPPVVCHVPSLTCILCAHGSSLRRVPTACVPAMCCAGARPPPCGATTFRAGSWQPKHWRRPMAATQLTPECARGCKADSSLAASTCAAAGRRACALPAGQGGAGRRRGEPRKAGMGVGLVTARVPRNRWSMESLTWARGRGNPPTVEGGGVAGLHRATATAPVPFQQAHARRARRASAAQAPWRP